MKDLVLLRANIIGGMNAYIEDLNNKDVYGEWVATYPHGATEDDLMEIAENEVYWLDIVVAFEGCLEMAKTI
jgi:hypothetical protein